MNGYVSADLFALFLMVWFITSFLRMFTANYKAEEARWKRLKERERRQYESYNRKSH